MAVKSVFAEKRDLYDLIPVIQNWLIENGYDVTAIANRIDAKKGESIVTLFLENYPAGCLIKVISSDQFFENLREYLSKQHLLTYQISCPYCGKVVEASKTKCPFCGAPIK